MKNVNILIKVIIVGKRTTASNCTQVLIALVSVKTLRYVLGDTEKFVKMETLAFSMNHNPLNLSMMEISLLMILKGERC